MRRLYVPFLIVFLAASAAPSIAGLGPENVLVVANQADQTSVTIAREYVRLRRVPESNLVMLDNVPSSHTISLADFRMRILGPVLAAIKTRRLDRQIACVAYSSGFPYAVDVRAAMAGKSFPRYITQPASLTGLTYLHTLLDAAEPIYLAMDANWYHRGIRRQARPAAYSASDMELKAELDGIVARLQPSVHAANRPPEVRRDLQRALELARQLSARRASDPALLYDLACLYALNDMPDDATRTLSLAVQAGWTNRAHTERDPDLASLRDRADFRRLIERMSAATYSIEPARPFRVGARWAADGTPTTHPSGRRYMLACMLAYVGEKANSEEEALACLRRSAMADYRRPRGTIYFMASSDQARTGPRQWAFEPAKAALARLGVRAEVISGVLPSDRNDVAGAVVGAATIDWASSRSRIVPGAFCDHLTSLAGVMSGGGQTLLSEWLRHGAAGSSGTVTEPYNIAAKFPSAFLHVFYASGCSLAEAFYQSVAGPYQQLLVGDPLCAPWARPISVRVAGIKPGATLSRPVQLRPSASGAQPIHRFELYVDGVLTQVALPGKPLRLSPAVLRAGRHEARIVAVAGALEWRGKVVLPFRTVGP